MARIPRRKGQVQPIASLAADDRRLFPIAKRVDVDVAIDGRLGGELTESGGENREGHQGQALPELRFASVFRLRQRDPFPRVIAL